MDLNTTMTACIGEGCKGRHDGWCLHEVDDVQRRRLLAHRRESARGSGRTTKTLERAFALADEGKRVLVLVGNGGMVTAVRAHLDEVARRRGAIDLSFFDRQVCIRPYEDVQGTAYLLGHKFDAVLEDHTVAESRDRAWESAKARLVL